MKKKVDYLIQGGHVIDGYRNISEVKDLAIKDGKIVDSENVDPTYVIDATGCIVTPGLIDFHCHVAERVTELGIPVESSCFPTGVTTAVDAGSTGVSNYEAFRTMSMNSRVRIKAFLNVCAAGLVTSAYHENINPDYFRKEKILDFLNKYSDQLIGLKIRQSAEIAGELGIKPMKRMLEIAEEAKCPVVVHTTNPPVSPEEIVEMLRPGDVYAHVYQGKGMTVVRDGNVISELPDAQKRGVIFDAANGGNHFGFKVAETCMKEGFLPDIISTDLTVKTMYIPGKVFSLPFIMSKYLAMGMALEEIVERVTTIPARVLGEEKELGSLCEGTCADIVIHKLIDHPTVFQDFFGDERKGEKLFKTQMTFRAGMPVFRQIDF
ncbi:MAG: metallo-dependent hydrolase [Lachnospiraceae bacterium]|nr:metallo-dependent hydrolase [Lachnospiraceae bacterium]